MTPGSDTEPLASRLSSLASRGPLVSSVEDCCGRECVYAVHHVRALRRLGPRGLMELAEDQRGAMHQLEHHGDDDTPCPEPGDGGRASSRSTDSWTSWIAHAADLERARQAGCKSDEEVARYLCPFAVHVENIRDAE